MGATTRERTDNNSDRKDGNHHIVGADVKDFGGSVYKTALETEDGELGSGNILRLLSVGRCEHRL
jgi:hypothetical protein